MRCVPAIAHLVAVALIQAEGLEKQGPVSNEIERIWNPRRNGRPGDIAQSQAHVATSRSMQRVAAGNSGSSPPHGLAVGDKIVGENLAVAGAGCNYGKNIPWS